MHAVEVLTGLGTWKFVVLSAISHWFRDVEMIYREPGSRESLPYRIDTAVQSYVPLFLQISSTVTFHIVNACR